MHPHTNCPDCKPRVVDLCNPSSPSSPSGGVTDEELVTFLINNQGRRSWQDNVAKLRKQYHITRRT
jgi:hypothetical protein